MNQLLAVAFWMIEHLSPLQHRSALCGDLLEQWQAGRSGFWMVREVVSALGLAFVQRCGRFGMPVLFSGVWSTLYRGYAQPQPAVLPLWWSRELSDSLLGPITHQLLQIVSVVGFLWLGLALFSLVRRDVLQHLSVASVFLALSASHAALLLMVMLWPKNSAATLVPLLTERTFYVGWINLPVAVSLLLAILCVLPHDSGPPRRRRRVRTRLPLSSKRSRMKPIASASVLFCGALLPCPMHAQADRRAQVEQCTLSAVHMQGQPPACVPLEARMRELHVHGVSIAVLHEGAIDWVHGYGQATATAPVSADTLFQAGSISKPLTAMAALRLVQAGKLSLDGDVNALLRSWKLPADDRFPHATVTVRELLTHTAGLTVHGFPGYAAGEPVPSLLQVLNGTPPANTPAIRLEAPPGAGWNYSGGGYTVLQQVLLEATGKTFPALLLSSVLQPIGMAHSTYDQPLPASMQPHAAAPYLVSGDPVAGGAHLYPEQAAAGLWTTPGDLALYVLEVQRSLQGKANHVLSQKLTQEMLTPGKGHWGLGLEIGGSSANPYFSHGGVNAGFESSFVAYTKSGEGAVVMTNAEGGSQIVGEILRGIAAAYDWPDFRPKERELVRVEPRVLMRYVGTYRIPSGPAYVITLDNGRLYSTPPSGEKAELVPNSPTRFSIKGVDAEIEFESSEDGTVTQFKILHGDQTYSVPRMK